VSNSRHSPSLVRSYSITHPPGRVALPTEAGWDQIVLARTGLFTARTESRAWTIPAHRALCVPDGSRLRIETARRVGIRCLYTKTELGLLGDEVRVVNLDPLTHALIAHAIDTAPMNLDKPADTALISTSQSTNTRTAIQDRNPDESRHGQWRRRACILSAVAMLADGDNFTSVALRVGYASPSSFIAAFRAELDSAPRDFMRTAPASTRQALAM